MTSLLKPDPKKQNILATTQAHLDIETIVDDLIVLKNGIIALVIQTSAVNFDLLSAFEQEAKIKAFAGLINSIDFNMQILIRTNKIDISDYIKKLKELNVREKSPLIRRQIEIYTGFVKKMIIKNEVLDKKFYIIIPSRAGTVTRTSTLKQLFGREEKITNITKIVAESKPDLFPKRAHVIRLLESIGLLAKQLTTDELINLFYSLYNPETVIVNKAGLSFDLLKGKEQATQEAEKTKEPAETKIPGATSEQSNQSNIVRKTQSGTT